MLKVTISNVNDGSMLNRHDDKDENVIKNRERYLNKHTILMSQATRLDTQLTKRAKNNQENNFCRYFDLTQSDIGKGMYADDVVVADGIVTTIVNHALVLPVADCVGAILYSAKKRVLMLSHLGRHSLEQQGGVKSVEYLITKYQVDPAELQVWLTPAAGKTKYPIWALDGQGMKEATLSQLISAGIQDYNIIDSPENTDEDETFYSYSEYLKGNRKEDGDHMIVAVMQ